MADVVVLRKESIVTLVARAPSQIVIPGNLPPSPLVLSRPFQSMIIQRDGIPGPPGLDGFGLINSFEFTVLVAGAQFFQLSGNVNKGILHVNGLFQLTSYYSFNSSQLTLSNSMGLEVGDIISFTY